VLIYPVTDYNFDTPSYLENAQGCYLTRNAMRYFWAHYLPHSDAASQPYASPLRANDLRGLPAALVITAEYDPLRDEGEAYAARLREAGVEVTLRRYPGMIHGFVRRLHLFDQAKVALRQVADALRQRLVAAPEFRSDG
jgi:acetyl esterase